MPTTPRAPHNKTTQTTTTTQIFQNRATTRAFGSNHGAFWRTTSMETACSAKQPFGQPLASACVQYKKRQGYRHVPSGKIHAGESSWCNTKPLLLLFPWAAAPHSQSSQLSQSTQVLGGVVWIKVPAPPAELITFCLCGNVLNLKSINSSS